MKEEIVLDVPVDFKKTIAQSKIIILKQLLLRNFCLYSIAISIAFSIGCKTEITSFYLSPSGNDNNSGTIRRPWKSIDRINHTSFSPGSKVLFEGGATFNGTIKLDSLDKGTSDKNIIIGSYGNGNAVIDGGDAEGIIIKECEHFVIKNMVIRGNGRKGGNVADGILISSSDNFNLDSLEVFGFQHSGVHVRDSKNARITHIIAHDNGFAGIHVTGINGNDPVSYGNENLYIGYCKAYNNPGDPTVLNNHSGNGILASSVSKGLIEYCEAFNNGWDMPWTGNGPVGIWIWDCADFTIQYSISHDNKTNPVAKDGGGFDFDGGVSNSVIQYCISYDNEGAGYGLFEFGASKPWENNIVRYNISLNDGIINEGSLAIWKDERSGTMRNCEIHNNTFFNDTLRGISISFITNCQGFTFSKNIFVYRDSFIGKGQKINSEIFTSNIFWSLTGNRIIPPGLSGGGIVKDPRLKNPGQARITDPLKINTNSALLPSLK